MKTQKSKKSKKGRRRVKEKLVRPDINMDSNLARSRRAKRTSTGRRRHGPPLGEVVVNLFHRFGGTRVCRRVRRFVVGLRAHLLGNVRRLIFVARRMLCPAVASGRGVRDAREREAFHLLSSALLQQAQIEIDPLPHRYGKYSRERDYGRFE